MLVAHALLAPSLPTLLVDQHRGHRTPMLQALAAAAERLAADRPEVMLVMSARWGTEGPFRVGASRRFTTLTDYSGFGVEVRHDCDGHPALARALVEAGTRAGLAVAAAERGVDSGVTVPLHFLEPSRRVPVVPLSLPPRPLGECRAWGGVLRATLEAWPSRAAFVVGGGLSRNEHAWNLKREVPEAETLDRLVVERLERGVWDPAGADELALTDRARPEAGLRHLQVLRGFLGRDVPGRVLAYEGATGVGAALIEFALAPADAAGGAAPAR